MQIYIYSHIRSPQKPNTVIIVTSYIHTDMGRRDIDGVPRNRI